MPQFKIIYKFKTSVTSWSETYYATRSGLDSFSQPTTDEKNKIVGWRPSAVTLLESKVIEEGGLNRAKVFQTNASGNDTDAKDVSAVTVFSRLDFADFGFRHVEVCGVADDDIIGSLTTESIISASLRASLQSMFNALVKPPFSFLGRRLIPHTETGFELHQVSKIEPDPNVENWTQCTVAPAMTLPFVSAQSTVKFQGVKKSVIPWLQGNYKVVGSPTTTTFSIPTQYRYFKASYAPENIRVRLVGYDYPQLKVTNRYKVGGRQRRGPFSGRRGARPAVRVR